MDDERAFAAFAQIAVAEPPLPRCGAREWDVLCQRLLRAASTGSDIPGARDTSSAVARACRVR